MTAIWMRARSELRSRLSAILALAVIVGVIGGVVIAAAAGARRTESAYPRFVAAKHGLDVVTSISVSARTTPSTLKEEARAIGQIEALPEVAATSHVTLAQGELRVAGGKPGNVFPIVSPDGRFGTTINAVKILRGRMYDPNAPDEIVPSFAVADDLGLRVGDTVQLSYGSLFGSPHPPGSKRPDPVPLHVVGIAAVPGMFQPLAGGYLPGVLVSRGFYRAHRDFIDPADFTAAIVLHRGVADFHSFVAGVNKLRAHLPPHVQIQLPFNQHQQTAGVQQATRTQAVSLWLLAVLVAIAGIAIFGQALARQTFLESIEYPSLRAMGISPSQLFALGMIRAGLIGLVGGAVAVVIGVSLSPLTPTGIARIAEPNPGFAIDLVAVAAGGVGTAVVIALLGAIPAWRAAVRSGNALGTAEALGSRRPSALAGFMARASFPPSATAGVRMAVEPGRGRTAVPVRTTMFGAALSLFALAGALSFGSSLNRLVTTPGLSGWNWDVLTFPETSHNAEALGKKIETILDLSPQVQAYAMGDVDNVQVNGLGVLEIAMGSRKGSVTPSLVEGQLPQNANHVALGTDTMRRLDLGLGDIVSVARRGLEFRMRVVGRVAIPSFPFSFSRPGQGAALSLSGAVRLDPNRTPDGGGFFIRFAPGVDQQAFLTDLRHRVGAHLAVLAQPKSGQLKSLQGITDVPIVLAGIVALMAAATLAHTLITSIRRRRLDLAILKTLGFVRRQVSATVAWQATTLASVAVLIGLPLGVLGGRWGWHEFSDRLGVVPQVVIPGIAILSAVPATILVANLLAVVPGRIASRLKAASVMRTE